MKKRAVVVGYATLDYVLTTALPLQGAGTIPATMLTSESWPRAGGAALYATRRLAASGHSAWPLVSIGDDANGSAYRRACRDAGVGSEGIATDNCQKTPSCLLIYHDDGQYTCLLDLGPDPSVRLAPSQIDLLAEADVVVVAATNADLIRDVLRRVTSNQLAWIAKDDPHCFPLDLCRELTQRADYLFCNTAEYHLIAPYLVEAKPGILLFETHGASGVRIRHRADNRFIPASPLERRDTTGAGDTFAGEVLAHLLKFEASPERAAKHGVEQVRQMLLARSR